MKKIDVVELFAGVGGFRVGLNKITSFNQDTGRAIEKGRWNFVWANQWEPSTKTQPAFDCYVTRFGQNNAINVDISLVDKETIPDHTLLVGGFPCQDYSVARSLSNEMGIQGQKGVLWWQIAEVLFKKKPKFVLLENVDRLLKSPANQRGRDFAVMLKTFEDLGYIVQWRMINAGEYGMPQRRRRVFIYATHIETDYAKKVLNNENIKEYLINDGFFNSIFPIINKEDKIEIKDLSEYSDSVIVTNNYNQGKFLTSGIFLKGKVYNFNVLEKTSKNIYTLEKVLEASKEYNSNIESYLLTDKELIKWDYLKEYKRIDRVSKNGTKYVYSEGKMTHPDCLNLPARTMLTSEGTTNRSSHSVLDPEINKIRKITEVEAEIIQMFPPNWTNTGMTPRQRYFMMGNALVTGIISKIEKKLYDIINQESK